MNDINLQTIVAAMKLGHKMRIRRNDFNETAETRPEVALAAAGLPNGADHCLAFLDGLTQQPRVGMLATIYHYSDRDAAEVVKVSPNGRTIWVRKRKLVTVKQPKVAPGGFSIVVVEDGEWTSADDPDGAVERYSLRSNGKWKRAGWPTRSPGGTIALGIHAPYYNTAF